MNLSLNAAVLFLSITTDPTVESDVVQAPEHAGLAADRAIALRAEHIKRIHARRMPELRRRRR
ncbi:hypothetical protein [Amycolatopsis jejuensis]|uniref:hypothetical protein n=1 Tax=Amycolatopsis jejuensis TaxID=330084 RepID=UPI000B0044A8|nr:hypothetical protein [Amycolatopsis jejuensis]